MLRSFFLFSFLVFVCTLNAVEKKSYFQQKTDYAINVTLNDELHELDGELNLSYTNNSPDTLQSIYFHLWPNAYRNKQTAFAKQQLEVGSTKFHFSKPQQRGFIDALDFNVNDRKASILPDPENIDIIQLRLPEPLLPGDSCLIQTPFHVKIPASFSRLGYTKRDYQISQWYPKPAVYDMNGWHPMPYLDMGEFYSEFGRFDVSITLPKDYIVGATGNLQSPLEAQWLKELAATNLGSDSLKAPYTSELKTIRFTEKNIHDFAWFASKEYRIKEGTTILPNSEDTVEIMAMYYPNSVVWNNALTYINDAILFYSEKYMNYPYKTCTAVEGALQAGGAMEYPTITVVGSTSNAYILELMIMHEVGHNWFYGILGFNERDYPWMDEGLNSFSESRYMKNKYPHLKASEAYGLGYKLARFLNIDDFSYHKIQELAYRIPASTNNDQSAGMKSTSYNAMNYGMMVYMKNQAINNHLLQSMGEDDYDAMMHSFFRIWAYKHPQPADYLTHLRANAPLAPEWYFNDLMHSTKHLDYKITGIKDSSVLIRNKGDIAAPVYLKIKGFSDTSFWAKGFRGDKSFKIDEPVISASIYDSITIAAFNPNNHYKGKGSRPLDLSHLQLINKGNKTQLGILPMLSWNNYNGMMGGIILHNPILPSGKFEYTLAPFYGFKNNGFAGFGNAQLNFLPRHTEILRTWSIVLKTQQFAYGSDKDQNYQKLRLGVKFILGPGDKRRTHKTTLYAGIQRSTKLEDILSNNANTSMNNYFLSSVDFSSNKALTKKTAGLRVIGHENFGRADARCTYAIELVKKLIITGRFYGSAMLNKSDHLESIYFPSLNSIRGQNDFLYDHLYLGRFEHPMNTNSLLSQQIAPGGGGFISDMPFAFSSSWLSTFNLTVKLPKVPGFFYANFGSYQGMKDERWNINGRIIDPGYLVTEGGWAFGMGPMKIYLPIWGGYMDGFTENYWQKIRFSIKIEDAMNFRKLLEGMF